MLKRDYILTMVEQLGYVLARVLFLKETRRFDVAEVEVQDFLGKIFGIGARALREATEEQLHELCVEEGEFQPHRAVALASLLKELGDIDSRRDDAQYEPCGSYERALLLLLDAYGDGTVALPLDAVDTLELMIERCAACGLDPSVQRRLLRHLELTGYYADAEDLLYEMLDAGTADRDGDAIPFYQRLLGRGDDDLLSGGLPREEVEEGMRSLRDRN
ncbi:MAG: hypothetical protein JST22_19170 [Bacteroidetes bacterium]|nr:hypothetical protein [Bacteroidota bacterium]